MSYTRQHLEETARLVAGLDADVIERIATLLAELRARATSTAGAREARARSSAPARRCFAMGLSR